MKNKTGDYGAAYRFCRGAIHLFKKKYSVVFEGGTAPAPAVYIIHHNNTRGPLTCAAWFPEVIRIWGLSCFFSFRECYSQYVNYTFTKRYGRNRLIAKLQAIPSALIVSFFYRQGRFIPVYRGKNKIVETFKFTDRVLKKGESVLIAPDVNYTDESEEIGTLYEGFLNIEKYYYRASGEHIPFVPLKIDFEKRVITARKPVYFEDGDFKAQRARVLEEIRRGM